MWLISTYLLATCGGVSQALPRQAVLPLFEVRDLDQRRPGSDSLAKISTLVAP